MLCYKAMLVSTVQQSESVLCVYIYLFSGLPSDLGHHRVPDSISCAVQ